MDPDLDGGKELTAGQFGAANKTFLFWGLLEKSSAKHRIQRATDGTAHPPWNLSVNLWNRRLKSTQSRIPMHGLPAFE